MMKHRILYLDHGTKPIGGGQVNTLSLIRDLNKDIFTPIVLSSAENDFTVSARAMGVEVIVQPLPRQLTSIGRYSVRYDPYHLSIYLWHAIAFTLQLRRLVLEQRIDLLHPCDNLMRVVAGVLARTMGIPAVCPIMDDFETNATSRLLRAIFLRTMDYLLPVSEKAAAFFRGTGDHKAKIVVTYTGIDLDQFTRPVPDGANGKGTAANGNKLVIGIVGRLIPIKGHRELFAALATVKKDGTLPFRCTVVGDGPDLPALKKLSVDLGIQDDVVFAGFHRDVAGIMSTFDVVVAPSRMEASSRVVLEAGALKKPVIATRVGGLPEMVEEGVTGLLVALDDIEGLSAAIKALGNAELRARMGNAGHERVTRLFSSRAITHDIERIYLHAIRDAASRRQPGLTHLVP